MCKSRRHSTEVERRLLYSPLLSGRYRTGVAPDENTQTTQTIYCVFILTLNTIYGTIIVLHILTKEEGGITMHIGGLQKLTLLDYPGKVACTVFLSGCNLRCPYCHNPGLVLPEQSEGAEIPEAEVLSFLERRKGKLDGVCITGGEPTLQPELPEFLEKLRRLGYAVKLDTNGSFPDRLAALIDAGLVDYVAMDITNRPEKYKETAGCTDAQLAAVRRSVELLLEGRGDYEFRTTVTGKLHTPEDIGAAAAWIAGAKRYFHQPFKD